MGDGGGQGAGRQGLRVLDGERRGGERRGGESM